VKLRVSSIVFAKVDEDTKDVVETLSKETIAARVGLDAKYIDVTASEGSASGSARRLEESGMTINAKVTAPGGWSQKKLDSTVGSITVSGDLRVEMQEMMSELDGLQDASSGEMTFEPIEARRLDPEVSSTPSPSSAVSTESPNALLTSLRGGDTSEVSLANSHSFLLALVVALFGMF